MNRKILIITYYWPPSGGSGVQRWVKFVKYLPEFDIEPIVLIPGNPTYPATDPSLQKELRSDLKVFCSKSFEPFHLLQTIARKEHSRISKPTVRLQEHNNWKSQVLSWLRANLFIPDSRIGWLLTARSKALNIVRQQNIDTIITTGPPHSVHFIGRYVKKHAGVKWVADFRDPWSKVFYNQYLPRTSIADKIDRYLEKKILKIADEVIVISPSMAELQKEIYSREYHVISNGFDPDDFSSHNSGPEKGDGLIIRHLGTLAEPSIPYGFFNALKNIDHQQMLSVEFIGNVHEKIAQISKQEGMQEVISIKPYVPHEKAVEKMQQSNLLLLIIPEAEQNELILTGKLFEYIGSGRPIMLIGPVDGDAASIIKELKAGSCFEHDDDRGMAEFLEKMISQKPDSQRSDTFSLDDNHPYSRYQLTKKITSVINRERHA